jgi:hypothetical protein
MLTRNDSTPDGIFGELRTVSGGLVCITLEHSYEQDDGSWAPKVPGGTYTCQRGQHQLHSGPIETFEITNVPGHTGVLIHPGNDESASEGCVLLGTARVGVTITQSRAAFSKFMALEADQDTFQLTVIG